MGAIGLHGHAAYWEHGRNHRAGMDALASRTRWAWMLWPFVRTGNMDVTIGRARLLRPFARAGNMDVIARRKGTTCT